MEPKFNTSFIPKKPLASSMSSLPRDRGGHNIFNIIAGVIFALTILALGGAYIYRNIVIGQISQADKDLNSARSAFGVDKIQSILDANTRITTTRTLLEKHVVLSQLLTLLQTLTLKKMSLSDLIYTSNGNMPTLILTGTVQSYNALADQSDIFSKSDFIKDGSFSDFSLADNGDVKVKFSANLNTDLVSYKKLMDSSQSTQ